MVNKNIIKLVQLLIENGSKPTNCWSYTKNTLSLAIKTENLELIKIIEKLNPIPNKYTESFR